MPLKMTLLKQIPLSLSLSFFYFSSFS